MFPLSTSLYLSSPPKILIIFPLSLCLYVIVLSIFFLSSLSHLLSLFHGSLCFIFLSVSLLLACMLSYCISWFLYGSLCLQSPSPLSIFLSLLLYLYPSFSHAFRHFEWLWFTASTRTKSLIHFCFYSSRQRGKKIHPNEKIWIFKWNEIVFRCLLPLFRERASTIFSCPVF